MKKKISNLLDKFKNKPDIWFFYGFLSTFTLSIRKIIFYTPIKDTFNEYSATFIYLSDIFLILTILSWTISILCNRFISLSRYKMWIRLFFHRLYISIPIFFVFLSFLSLLWSKNLSIAFFKSLKILEFYILYIYIIFRFIPQLFHAEQFQNIQTSKILNLNCSTWNNSVKPKKSNDTNFPCRTFSGFKNFFSIIIFLGLFQAIIGIIQFFSKNSIGLFLLKESQISPEILGVAKIILNNEKFVRSYGLFPHPNILGGFLLFSITISFLYYKLFNPPHRRTGVEQFEEKNNKSPNQENVPRGTFWEKIYLKLNIDCSTWNIFNHFNLQKHFKTLSIKFNTTPKWLFMSIILIQILGLLLTFSKSAILGFFLAILYIYSVVPRMSDKRLFHVEQFRMNRTIKNKKDDNFIFSLKTKMFHVEHFWKNIKNWIFAKSENLKSESKLRIKNLINFFSKSKKIILVTLIILVSFFIFAKPSTKSLFTKSAQERISYLNVPRRTISTDLMLGIGTGQGVISMQNFFEKSLDAWEFQPIHNVFLIILTELGLTGLILFIWWIFRLFNPPHRRTDVEQFQNVPRGTILVYLKGILIGFIFIMLFDHYLWDIQQGNILFWMITGFIAGMNRR